MGYAILQRLLISPGLLCPCCSALCLDAFSFKNLIYLGIQLGNYWGKHGFHVVFVFTLSVDTFCPSKSQWLNEEAFDPGDDKWNHLVCQTRNGLSCDERMVMNFFCLPYPCSPSPHPSSFPAFVRGRSALFPWPVALHFHIQDCRSAVPAFAHPALNPSEPGGHRVILRLAPTWRDRVWACFSFHSMVLRVSSSQPREGKPPPRFSQTTKLRRCLLSVTTEERQIWAVPKRQGPLVPAPLRSRILLVRLLSCSRSKAENPFRHSACPSGAPEDEVKGREPITRDWPALFPKKCSLTSSWPSGFYKLKERELQNC